MRVTALPLTVAVAWLLALEARCAAEPGQQKQIRIVAFGDSTTALRDTVGKVYAQRLAEQLPARGIRVSIVNAGVPSNDTAGALERIERDVLKQHPDLLIVQFGINDSAVDVWKKPPATSPRVPLSSFRRNLTRIVELTRHGERKVILMTPNPMRWTAEMKAMYGKAPYKPADPDGFNVLLKDYAEAVRDVAAEQKIPLVDVYEAFLEHGRQKGRSVDQLLSDGVHPNDRGHEIVAQLLVEQIVAAIAGRQPSAAVGKPANN